MTPKQEPSMHMILDDDSNNDKNNINNGDNADNDDDYVCSIGLIADI